MMNGEQRVMYVRGILLQAEIEMQGMVAENQRAIAVGGIIPYGENDFKALIEKHGVHHNQLITDICDY